MRLDPIGKIPHMLTRWILFLGLLFLCTVCRPQDKPAASASQPIADSKSAPPAEPIPQNSAPDSKILEPTKIVKAVYPIDAGKDELQGQVIVKFTVSETGDVEKVEAISGNPILASAALDAAKKWKFKPFIRNGEPVKASTNIAFNFAFPQKVWDMKPRDAVTGRSPSTQAAGTPNSPHGTVGSQPGASTPQQTTPRVRVVQGVAQGLILHRVAPVYPPQAKRDRVQGAVVLAAIIGKDGTIAHLSVLSGPRELVDAAVGAVQQWRYRPYILNGEPTEVDTTITVSFTLKQY